MEDIDFYGRRSIAKQKKLRHYIARVQGAMLHAAGGWPWNKEAADQIDARRRNC